MKKVILVFILLPTVLLFTNCNTFYLQNATVLTNRKAPTITTSFEQHQKLDIEISGGYSGKDPAEYTQGMHTDYVSSNGTFDYECASDTNCNDSLANNARYSGDNIALHTSQWNAGLQLSFVPFYKKTDSKVFALRILAEAQYGMSENMGYLNLKFGPTFSSIGNRFAIHPKLLFGCSKINATYQALTRHEIDHISLLSDSSYYTYTWEPDSGAIDSYRFFTELGATLEIPLNRTFSILTDVCGTYQYLFDYANGEHIYLAYAEFSPAIKISASQYFAIVSGFSIPYNPDMNTQLPMQCFAKMHISVGPFGGMEE